MLNRAQAPITSLPSKLDLPKVELDTLDNNVRLYSLKGASEPVVQLSMMFEAGRYFEQNRGVAALTAQMVNKGTSTLSAQDISEKIAFHGATIKFQANMYSALVQLHCMKSELPKVMPVLLDLLSDASFPEEELNILTTRFKQKLKVNQEKGNFVAAQNFNAALYGEDHPFGYISSLDMYDKISSTQLRKHFKSHFGSSSLRFAILAGNIDATTLHAVKSALEMLKPSSDNNPPKIESVVKEPGRIDLHIKGNVQASLRVGNLCIPFNHEDYNDLQTVNTILGGYFGSRLMSNIREDKGYTYGVYSFINPIMENSYFCISTDVGIKYKDATLQEISNEIKRLQEEPISKNELEMVKNYLIGQMMKSVDGPLKMANTLKDLLINDADVSVLNKQMNAIQAINADKVMEMANKYFNFDKMYKVVTA